MKISLYSREIKMLLHLISISIFSIPITTHVLRIALDKEFCIGELAFDSSDSMKVIVLILLMISVNIISIMTNKFHKLSLLVTGIFFFTVTLIQLLVLNAKVPMIVLGYPWEGDISIFEAYMTGIFCLILFVYAYLIEDKKVEQNKEDKVNIDNKKVEDINEKKDLVNIMPVKQSIISFNGIVKNFLDTIEKLDRRLVFLLGIICSLILAIPICLILYEVAESLLIESKYLKPKEIKLLAWIGVVGMQGSIISMLLSFRRFDEAQKEISKLQLFLNALFRPFIGLSFAHLSYFMLESGLLQNGLEDELGHKLNEAEEVILFSFNYHVCIAFIAGFTERIARVIQPLSTNEHRNEEGIEKGKSINEIEQKTDVIRDTINNEGEQPENSNETDGIALL
ncbi:hypothetical protein [Aquimarina sp. 2304DJ70-9]|uniref:hypothetical protein n=1 Tax=Aquimarina penaris TaxID=3231044 RepID=UPI003462826C